MCLCVWIVCEQKNREIRRAKKLEFTAFGARLLLDKFECYIFYMSAKETFLGNNDADKRNKHEWSNKKHNLNGTVRL